MKKIILIFLAILLFNVHISKACDCRIPSTLQAYCGSTIVAVGAIIDILQELPSSLPCRSPDGTGPIRMRAVHFIPSEVYKGVLPKHAFFLTPMHGGECAFSVEQFEHALLFISPSGVVSLCSASIANLPGNWRNLDIIKELQSLKVKFEHDGAEICRDVPASIDLDFE